MCSLPLRRSLNVAPFDHALDWHGARMFDPICECGLGHNDII
jgi:hypothetical protein